MQLDPFSLKRQMTVARTAIQSRLGEARSQGYESFQGRSYRGLPGPLRPAFDRNAHLWQVRLPADLPVGVHKLTITTTDRHGQETVEHRVFEVHQQRPPRYWREKVWQGQD